MSAQLWTALLSGTLITAALTGAKFAFDAVTGRRVRRVVDGEAELRLAEMVKRVAADEVETLSARLEVTEARSRQDRELITGLHVKVESLERERETAKTEIAGLQRRIAGVIDDRDDLVRYITVLRQWIASGARPPAPMVPAHLADVVPQWVPGDGAEPPLRVRPDGID